jgi:cob(I)alamin adenosyltransferase
MKIYTKTGDSGDTALYRGGRVSKDDPRIQACGAVDELNSHLGWLRCQGLPPDLNKLLTRIQNDLFTIGADLATPAEAVRPGDKVARLEGGAELFLEEAIDKMEEKLTPIRRFILPSGKPQATVAHIARAVCRRAERTVVTLARQKSVAEPVLVYLNRLSDFLFVMARYINDQAGVPDEFWEG